MFFSFSFGIYRHSESCSVNGTICLDDVNGPSAVEREQFQKECLYFVKGRIEFSNVLLANKSGERGQTVISFF